MLENQRLDGCCNTAPSLTNYRIRSAIMAIPLNAEFSAESKTCKGCGVSFTRPAGMYPSKWKAREYCGFECVKRTSRTRPASDRFYEKVDSSPGNGLQGDCHFWTAHLNSHGYGTFAMWGKSDLAHRVAYFLATGMHPGDHEVCHTCDTPWCVNPEHLWLGDHSKNMADMAAKGRGRPPKGAQHTSAKLTENDVQMVRSSAESTASLARQLGVTEGAIASIRKGRTWRSVT